MNHATTSAQPAATGASDRVTLAGLDPEHAEVRELDYDSTVPRGLVHRNAVSEVFVTDSQQTGESTFDVAAQLPAATSCWSRPPTTCP
ncbi:hypothetical protein HFP72_05480 [Nocardiopsis sp. ARC36]